MSLSLFPDTVKLEILHPITKEPTGFVLELIGQDHDDMKAEFFKGAKALSESKTASDPKVLIDAARHVFTKAIVGWTNTSEDIKAVFAKLGFTDDTFSPEKAEKLLSLPTTGFIRDQIDKVVSDRERFFKTASAS